jgi:hypothetical protein
MHKSWDNFMFRIKEQETHEIIYQILGQNIKIRKS